MRIQSLKTRRVSLSVQTVMIRRPTSRRAVKQTNYFCNKREEGGYPLPTPNVSRRISVAGEARLGTLKIAMKILPDLKGAKKSTEKKERIFMVGDIIAYENGEMDEEEVISLFQELVDTGMAWALQGHYGRTAQALLDAGEIS
jgi:hypothetical protein